MRKTPIVRMMIIIVMLALCAGVSLPIACSKKSSEKEATGKDIIYTCPMHPNYLSHQPGSCPICGMTLVPATKSTQPKDQGNGKVLYYRDAMNPSFTSSKPGKAPDGMDLVPVYESEAAGNDIHIAPAMIQSIGVQTEKAAIRMLTKEIRTSATIMPDERRQTAVTTKIMGYVENLYVNYTGQRVQKGRPLYDLYSPDLVSAQAEYLETYKNSRTQDSGLLNSSRLRLLNWDVSASQIAELEKRGEPQKTITVVSPANGIVTEKMIVKGQNVEPGMVLYKIVDYSNVWVEGAIYQQDVPLVNVGQSGTVELDYYPGERFTGKVTYIAPEMNMESRTLKIRLELANTSALKIKPGMNATVTIHSIMKKNSVTVPDQAVIHSGLRTLVVIAKGGGYFEPREIKIGQSAEGYTQVIEGVKDGEDIVVSSQFLIDSESNLKAAVMKMAAKQDSTK